MTEGDQVVDGGGGARRVVAGHHREQRSVRAAVEQHDVPALGVRGLHERIAAQACGQDEPVHLPPQQRVELGRLPDLVVLDDHQVFKAAASAAAWGNDAMTRTPPLGDILAGIPLAAGTDGTRASSYSPWLSLWWLITGTSLDGVRRREPEHLVSRERALECYTAGSAWLSFEETDRGHLRPGARADLAVLSEDYFAVAEARIPATCSELTVLGGSAVYSTGTVA